MNTSEAILSFSQSEKIKSGLIWISQSLQVLSAMEGPERQRGERIVKLLVDMVGTEALLARRIAPDDLWLGVEKSIDMAKVMIASGVPQEAGYHLTEALRHVTGIGHRSMSLLKERGLL